MSRNALESTAPGGATKTGAASRTARIRIESWSFPGALLAVLLILVYARGMGIPIRKALVEGDASRLNVFALAAGGLAGITFVALNWRRALEFLLSVRVGIAVLLFFVAGSLVSVLVHPRDPDKYLDLTFEQRERAHREDAHWAHGYFLYHLLHPYGLGMPTLEAPAEARPALDRMAQRYGKATARQEESGMRTALSGQVRSDEIRKLIERHEKAFDRFYEVSRVLQLSGTPTGKGAWSSDWFAAVMVLLFCMVLTNTFRRGLGRAIALAPPGLGFVRKLPSALWWDLRSLVSRSRIGFLTTHLGVLTALVGGLYSRATELRGMVQLSIDPQDQQGDLQQVSRAFKTHRGEVRFGTTSRPFAVRLANFRADYRDTLDLEFLEDPPTRTNPRFRWNEVWKGHQVPLDYHDDKPAIIVRVKEHWPRARVTYDIRERSVEEDAADPIEAGGPAIRVALEARGDVFESLLFARVPEHSLIAEIPALRIRLEGAESAAEQETKLRAPFEGERRGLLAVQVGEMGEKASEPTASVEIRENAVLPFDTPAGKARARIVQALPDARLMVDPNGRMQPAFATLSQDLIPPLHAGVELEIEAPSGERGRRWVYEDPRDSRSADRGTFRIGGTTVHFDVDWDRWASPARDRFRIVVAPGVPPRIARVGSGVTSELSPGARVTLGDQIVLSIDRIAHRPKIVPVIEPIPGDADADEVFFDRTHPGAARVEVDGPEGKQEFTLAARPFADSATYAGRLRITLFENSLSELPREWKSRLEMLELDDDGKAVTVKAAGTIRVNDYFTYRGYRFFQTDANAQLPGYSGVGVVHDPGIETVLTGLWAVVIGVAYVFFVKPFLVRPASPRSAA
jgi:hypothetical protein